MKIVCDNTSLLVKGKLVHCLKPCNASCAALTAKSKISLEFDKNDKRKKIITEILATGRH